MDVSRARASSKAPPPLSSRYSSSSSTLASSGGSSSGAGSGDAMSSSSSSIPPPSMHAAEPSTAHAPPVTPRRSSRLSIDDWSLFSSWRSSRSTNASSSSSSSRKQSSAADLASLDGKALRDAVWRESQQQQQQTARRGPRVIRFDPNGDASSSSSNSTSDHSDMAPLTPRVFDDAASTSTAEESSNAVTTPRAATRTIPSSSSPSSSSFPYDAEHDNGPSTGPSHEPSRLSLSFGRLSLRARDSVIADYKAKKYDVDWKRDQDCPDCQLCRLVFTKLSRRRHHCRICGDIVCSECSQDQVHCVDRFARPKRACAACFALLEAMMHLGDRRVKMYAQQPRGADSGAGAGAKEWTKVVPAISCLNSSSSASSSSSCSSSTRYHDRGTEIQRVAAAGKKARRAGSLGRRCVISASWLRAWLAFTRSDDDGNDADAASDHMLRSGRYRALSSVSALSSAAFDGRGAPPGPIDNLSLLELRQGVLRERQGLVQCRATHGQTPRHADARGGEYQIISLEVWDVLYRLYGGGPLIEVVASERPGAPDDWIVDVAAVLRRSRALGQAVEAASASLTPSSAKSMRVPIATTLTVADQVIERALVERHDPFHILLDVADGAFSHSNSGSSTADSPSPLAAVEPHAQPFSNNNDEADGRSKRIVKTSSFHRHAAEPDREPTESQPQRATTSLPPPRPSTRESSRDQSAAQAASAFALAMKQARLNAQKAISRPREQQL